ncbi:MAG: TetR/AcrR family transcriptional regulator [Deltaproteobacteria bacterium]|nr:TetR/AcrR family transcriptional regulator [Deltaproteobacteria bacterium]
MTSPHKLEWVRTPQQARSRETLERLLDAAEAVLAEGGLEGASVSEIARRAGSSVGAFYARFHDKEGLLRYLFERFDEQAEATAVVALEPARWDGVPLREALETMLRFLVDVLHEKRGLLGAMLTRMPTLPALGLLGDRLLGRVSGLVLALLRARGATVDRPDPAAAVRTAVWLVFGALELRAVAAGHAKPRESDDDVAAELAELCVRYLGLVEPKPAKRSDRRPPRPKARPRTSTRQTTEQPS